MKSAALQWDVVRGAVELNLRAAGQALEQALRAGARLVVLPELWTTSFPGPGPELDGELAAGAAEGRAWARRASAQHGIVVAGTYLAPAVDRGRFFNRLAVFDGGELLFEYDKLHLFKPTAEHEVFAPGQLPPPVVESSVGRLSGVICYDLRFGELFSWLLAEQADVIACPAQWPAAREVHWNALVRGRAVETQATLVAANRIGEELLGRAGRRLEFPGNSLVVDGHGRVAAQGHGQVGAVIGELDVEGNHRLRVHVPVRKDRQPDLYRGWAR